MTTFLATTTVAILRGTTTTDSFGDEVTTDATLSGFDRVPASLIERTKAVYDQSSGERRTVRVVTARMLPTVPVRESDRIRDNTTGITYSIEELNRTPRTIAGQSALTLDLKDNRG